ncbi:MAG TPA: 23S rRNA (adenine(2503)-C(2))-methyltransferase RlmN [Spirochaetota bacterium]|nr:23S rRNA (adenine(2503)-C(2))-methyltransferase RlmN [Spirochaetota bacterium]
MIRSILSSLDILQNDKNIDKPYRVKQIIEAIFIKRIFSFKEISNIPKQLRDYLSSMYYVLDVKPVKELVSKDGTIKFLFELTDGNCIESVYLKDKNNRITFCVSSQVGCRMGCKFCKTGLMGLIRNLSYSEIISQILYLSSVMDNDKDVVDTSFNIVFMGMGEPLDNYDELVKTIEILTDKRYFNLSQSRITISTCGVLDKIPKILERFNNLKIALSLITANNTKRKSIMPITNKFDIESLRHTLPDCYKKYKNRITLEYVLIKNLNMGNEDIDDLQIFNDEAFHINLIPLNHNDDNIERPTEDDIKTFQSKLEKKGFCVTRRFRRGDDIKADCGQLYWDVVKK